MNEKYKYIDNAALKKLVKDINGNIKVDEDALEKLRLVFEDTLRGHIGIIIGLTLEAGKETLSVDVIQNYLKIADH